MEATDRSEGEAMATHESTQPIVVDDDVELFAELIELPASDIPSFYQRNSGALPKSDTGMLDAHRRTELPRPDNSDGSTLKERVLGLLNR